MASRFVFPFADVGSGIVPADGAKLFFFASGTSDPKNTFTDEALTNPNANPVVADAKGVFGDIWMRDGDRYKMILEDKNGVQQPEVDPVIGGLLNGGSGLIFDTVAVMNLASPVIGQLARTLGNGSVGDPGFANYLTSANQPVDGFRDHAFANGNVALLQRSGSANVLQYGAKGDGLTGDKSQIQAAVDDKVVYDGLGFNSIYLPNNLTYALESEILIDAMRIDIAGDNSVIKWVGAADGVAIRIIDSSSCTVRDLVFLGDNTNTPKAAVQMESPSPAGTLGTNENSVIENIRVGRYFTQGATSGIFKNGILIDGPINGNNDQFTIRNSAVHDCTEFGIDVPNAQSIWSQIENTLMDTCNVGLRVGGDINLLNPQFNRNVVNDILTLRLQTVRITNLQSENSAECLRSNAGASFVVDGGKIVRNDAVENNYINHTSGGNLIVRDALFTNGMPGVLDKIVYSGSAIDKFTVSFENCFVNNADIRDVWDINSKGSSATPENAPDINIDVPGFRLQTTVPYTDETLDIPSIPAGSGAMIAGAVTAVNLGDFYNVSAFGDLQNLHLSPAITSAGVLRMMLINNTAGAIDLAPGRFRGLGLNDKVSVKNSESVTPGSVADSGVSQVSIPLAGAGLGDFITVASSVSWANLHVSAYVSATDTVQIHFANETGGSAVPAAGVASVGVVEPFGRFIESIGYTPAAIANGSTTSVAGAVVGARLGGHVFAAYTADHKGLTISANINSNDTVRITISNQTGGPVTLAAGSFNVMVS